jgi:hypothetical protein
MIDVKKIFNNSETRIFFSFVIGFGIAVLAFHKPFSSIIHLSIPVSQIEGRVIKHDDKCYSYVSEDVQCTNN